MAHREPADHIAEGASPQATPPTPLPRRAPQPARTPAEPAATEVRTSGQARAKDGRGGRANARRRPTPTVGV
eukprot:6384644-Alexandrium_andersonii.AAC.1